MSEVDLAGAPQVCDDAWDLYGSLGPWRQGDQRQDWALLRLVDAYARMLQPVDDLVRDTIDGPGWSQLLDVDRCPGGCLPWLGQFVGVDIDPSLPESGQREQIRAQQPKARGTPAAIVEVAQRYLNPGKIPSLLERAGGDPYALTVQTYSQHLAGASYAALQVQYPTIAAFQAAYPAYDDLPGSVSELTAAVKAAAPAGLVVTMTIASTASYLDVQAAYPTLAGFSAAFATWADVAAWLPP